MPLEELFKNASANDIIEELKSKRTTAQPDTQQAKKALDPKLHDINDPIIRPDKRVKIDNGLMMPTRLLARVKTKVVSELRK